MSQRPPPAAEALVEVEAVSKRFGRFAAVDDVSLTIPRNSFFALLGPSGCGKTTLLRMLGGFERATSGRILIDGEDMARVPPNRRAVNMVFQSYAVFPHMSVADNVAYGLKVSKTPAAEIGPRVEEAIGMVRLGGFEDRKPAQLSGGQRQRVALARALVKRPKLLLLDEPLSALDKKLREEMQLELVRLQHEVGITFVIVTHDQEEALSMADSIAVMQAGRIVQQDGPRQLYEHPHSRFVAEFIGASNILPCEVLSTEGDRATVESPHLGRIEVERATRQVAKGSLLIRPEKIRMGFSSPEAEPGEVLLDAQVEQVGYFGDLSFVHLKLADGTRLQCSRYNVNRLDRGDPPPGTATTVGLHPDDLLLVGE